MVSLKDHYDFQIIFLLIISIIFQVLIIDGKPFKGDNYENEITLFNEFAVSCYLYMLLCLTDFHG